MTDLKLDGRECSHSSRAEVFHVAPTRVGQPPGHPQGVPLRGMARRKEVSGNSSSCLEWNSTRLTLRPQHVRIHCFCSEALILASLRSFAVTAKPFLADALCGSSLNPDCWNALSGNQWRALDGNSCVFLARLGAASPSLPAMAHAWNPTQGGTWEARAAAGRHFHIAHTLPAA